MKVSFAYANTSKDILKEKVLTRVCTRACLKIKLPKEIVIHLKTLESSIYAETVVNSQYRNRIILNSNLTVKETIVPLVHELLHLSQMFTEKLTSRNGCYIWEGLEYRLPDAQTMNFKDYNSLPWELDVQYQEPMLLKFILEGV